MKTKLSLLILFVLVLSVGASAHHDLVYQLTKVLDHRTELNLTDAQVEKITKFINAAKEKINYSHSQADIRLMEIENLTSNWSQMHGVASRNLIEEYYSFMSDVYTTEINAVLQIRGVLEVNQLKMFEQLVPIIALNLEAPDHEMTSR